MIYTKKLLYCSLLGEKHMWLIFHHKFLLLKKGVDPKQLYVVDKFDYFLTVGSSHEWLAPIKK